MPGWDGCCAWIRAVVAAAFCSQTLAQGPLPSLACEGGLLGQLSAEFFELFELFQRRYARDSLTRSREFLYTIYLPKLSPHVDESVAACPVPVLELMMNAVLATEADYSLSEARELYEQVMREAKKLAPSRADVASMLAGWAGDTASTYPLLLGMQPQSCFGSSVKIYVYDVPEVFTSPVLQCAHGQWGTEVLFHRFLLQATCRTLDPEEADFFFVPLYGTCLTVQMSIKNDEQAAKLIWDPLVAFLSSSPWFLRRNQRDHIFLFADGQSARVWDSYELVRAEAIFFVTEAKCPTWNVPVRRYTDVTTCASSWKDVIIPGHTDIARTRTMQRHNLPSEERDLLMTFHGRHPDSHEVYRHCKVRASIMELAELDGVDVGGFVEDYLERKGRSRFCLIPGGTSPWTNHLYESFFCGCVPVILSDEYEVAFQHLLDWPLFSIKWPEEAVGQELYEFLRSFPEERLREMKRQVDVHACWFDYFSEREDCSPFLAVVRALDDRKKRLPPSHGRFWNAEDVLKTAHPHPQLPRRTTRFHISDNETFLL